MQLTQRAQTAGAVGVVLAVFAVGVGSVLLTVGATLVFGWLLASQLTALRQFQTTAAATTVSVTPSTTAAQADSEIPVTVSVERPLQAASSTLSITVPLPPAAQTIPEADRTLTLAVGETQASISFLLTVPVAGRMQFSPPAWRLTDHAELFTESFERGPTPTVTLETPTIQDLHVGRGGNQLSAFGEHATDRTGDGITPASLRQYIKGDPADRIDWKATARLNEPHVREFEAESDLELSLIVDHRAQMARGADESMLSYAREAALGIVSNAATTGDPIGLVTVGDEGITTIEAPTKQDRGYARIKERLLALEPTPQGPPSSTVQLHHPESVRQLTQRLDGDQTPFAETLTAFTTDVTSYLRRIETDPLYGAVQYLQSTTSATQLTVIVTSDHNRSQLRQTVRAAVGGDSAVLVFLTPLVLFEPGGLSDLEGAYQRYEAFESFRTDLERLGPVVAYEVAPGDRLAAVLSDRRRTTTTEPLRGSP